MAPSTTLRTKGISYFTPFIFMIALSIMAHGQETLRIKGQVIVSDQVRTDVDLTVDVGDTSCVQVLLFGRGRFEMDAVENERYEFRFEQVGSVSKSVIIDTANSEFKAGQKDRTIEFDVVMAPMDTVAPLVYTKPVGRIFFHYSNGRMVVERDHTMAPAREVEWIK